MVWFRPKEKWMAMFWLTSAGATLAFRSAGTANVLFVIVVPS